MATPKCMQSTQIQNLVISFIGDKISKNFECLWILRICFSQFFQDTFYTWNAHLGTFMVELIKPSCQAYTGAQKLFFIWINDWMFL